MLRLLATIKKELLILVRDRSGLAILFVMPVVLVTLMALIQDAPFRDYQELKIPLVLLNEDKGDLGKKITDGLGHSKIFEVNNFTGSASDAKALVAQGEYQIGIIIPDKASEEMNKKVGFFVNETLVSMGLVDSVGLNNDTSTTPLPVIVFFAPDIKKSFKNSVLSSIKQVASKVESQSLLNSFKKELGAKEDEGETTPQQEFGDFISFAEESAVENPTTNLQLNSVQHNVPAWTIFGMFFIVITLAGSMIKEREDGSYLRIRTMPGSYMTVMAGKIMTYLMVCLVQCFLMLLVGIFILPALGLPTLSIGSNMAAIAFVAICCGLAATGYGVFVGTLFNTHQQSATFGAVSVVILAALGGIWVPVYVMPDVIRVLAEFSPLYWGLNAFQNLFLSNGTFVNVLSYTNKLLFFFIFALGLSFIINKFKNN
ncbi:MAG TPA: ABC transporter permease [Bacteroidia bacterium]|nr:ABC transporter permease [Bacteroidia bacterium]